MRGKEQLQGCRAGKRRDEKAISAISLLASRAKRRLEVSYTEGVLERLDCAVGLRVEKVLEGRDLGKRGGRRL